MTSPSEVIDLMSAGGRHTEELVIDLASPEQPEGVYRQGMVEVDSNNFLPQFQGQSGSQQEPDETAYSRVHAVRTAQKRLWEDPVRVQEQQRQLARRMQWGSTGPRMQRNRASAAEQELQQPPPAANAAAADPQGLPRFSATSGRRRLSVVARRQVAPAAGTGHRRGEQATIVIDDDSPRPRTLRQQQLGLRSSSTAAAATVSRPAPTAIQGNPRYSYRNTGTAATGQQENQLDTLMRLRSGRRSSGSITVTEGDDFNPSSSGNSLSSSDAEVARKAQEEEDAQMALRMMREEEQQAQRIAEERHRRRMELLQQLEAEEAAAAAAATEAVGPSRARGRRGGRAPQRAEPQQQHVHQHQANPHWGMAMAHALLQLPRWGAGGSGRGRGLPPGLTAMREAVLGMQAAGLPPHLLFSDRDFGADDYEMLLRLDETVEKKGAKTSTIEALPTQTVPAGGITGTAGEKLSCAVCLEEYAEGAELRTLPCLHKFHKGCIDQWLGMKASCPVCNRECS